MGDRNNPIKFGPEWLRNLSRERSAGSSASSNQNVAGASGASSSGAPGASGGAAASSSTSVANTNTANAPPKVQLAKLRYGREEMLALYDRTSEPPPELKYIDILYQPRGKAPVALNNTFEDDMRETLRSGPPIGGMSPGERFGAGRGRGLSISDGRGRPRIPFVRQPSTGRGTSWHLGSPRMPNYSNAAADDDTAPALRSWNTSNNVNTATRNSGDLSEWPAQKMFRSKRPGSNSNWRQPPRDEAEEWRSSEAGRSRSSHQDKWDRDWSDRPGQDKSPSWNSNRRTWVGDTQNDDNLPEWADSAEACTGTFDSSGAFHGYSNDDTNLPKSQEAAYPLTRSHTHGSFVRSKTAEEGSEEWWASEKAKKLSPKRFDASEIKFKKPITNIPDGNVNPKQNPGKEDTCQHKVAENTENAGATSEVSESNTCLDDSFNKKNVRFSESKTFDALMRSDINLEEATDERGNFQSVMITPNNSLRQKHQNIVSSISNNTNRQSRKPSLLQILQNKPVGQSAESDRSKQQQLTEDKLVDCLMNISLDDKDILSKMPSANDGPLLNASTSMSLSSAANSMSQMTNPLMQIRMSSPVLPNQGMGMNLKSNLAAPGIHSGGMQSIGITNSALNASLGLPLCPPNNAMGQSMGIPLHGVPPPILPSHGMSNPNMGSSALQSAGTGISGFPTSGIQGMHGMHGIHGVHGMHSMQSIQGVQGVQGIQSIQGIQGMSGMSGIQGMSSANIGNNSMFLGQNTNNSTLQASTDIPMPNHGGQSNMFPMHGLQHTGPPTAFGSSIYGNIMSQPPASNTPNQNLPEQWYYEDPKKNIQGPFTSKDMYNWYRAGFFSPSLMVRRTCDTHMRPLGSYGPVVPFNPVDPMYPVSGGFESRNQPPHDTLLTSQPGLGLDVMNMSNLTDSNTVDSMQFGTVGLMRNTPFRQQQMVDSLWSQPSSDLMWMQQAMNTRNENRVNNLPMFFWDQQPSAIASNSLLPEEIVKEMKTEDQILAQLRASQNINAPQNLHFLNEHPTASANIPEVSYITDVSVTPNLEDLQKLIEEDTLKDVSSVTDDARLESRERQTKLQKPTKEIEQNNGKSLPQASSKITTEIKIASQVKNETEKSIKNKENNNAKNKNIKKAKDEKKEEILEKPKEEDTTQVEKRQEELSLQKKRDDKSNKREQKEWIREGFTIVKAERNMIKDNRKRAEEFRAAEEAERKRKEEERMIFEEERKRRQLEAYRRQQEIQLQQQRQIAESVNKKAPWSTITNLSFHTLNKDGLTLAEIQRLEREKKLEQMREQQQMMHLIAQQQAASLAREQEMQAGLGWAKKKAANLSGQSLAEIQAETRKQAAAAASAQTLEDSLAIPLPPVNHVPWANSHNGGGFWDTQPPVQSPKQPVSPKIVEPTIIKKKPIVKQASPATEFEMWCTTALSSWSTKIDVPTFVAFLRDLESPYEIKDYVKCYLGDTKETNDFARHFLERRSKLLRVGMDTPSDDLCSPAAAINPRSISGSDDAKGKGKRTKKNKMLKVDARILGFSVTAAEDRINVGDIDLA